MTRIGPPEDHEECDQEIARLRAERDKYKTMAGVRAGHAQVAEERLVEIERLRAERDEAIQMLRGRDAEIARLRDAGLRLAADAARQDVELDRLQEALQKIADNDGANAAAPVDMRRAAILALGW